MGILILVSLLGGISPLSSTEVYAETVTTIHTGLPGENNNASTPVKFLDRAISWFIRLTAMISILAVTGSGLMYVISMGEPEKVKKAKSFIIYALLGLGVSLGSLLIVTIISQFKL